MEEIFDTTDEDYALAFALIDFVTGKPKDDPRFVRWFAVSYKFVGSEILEHLIPVHTCTDADYAKFKTPTTSSQVQFEKLRKDGGLKCVDWKSEEIEIFGGASSLESGGLDIMVMPCNVAWPVLKSKGGTYQEVSDECEWDK